MPPDGNELASGSPRTSSLPLNSVMAVPSLDGCRKVSCFSAVRPVIGWNRGVKWVAPRSIAQAFIAAAEVLGLAGSSAPPSLIVFFRGFKTGFWDILPLDRSFEEF